MWSARQRSRPNGEPRLSALAEGNDPLGRAEGTSLNSELCAESALAEIRSVLHDDIFEAL